MFRIVAAAFMLVALAWPSVPRSPPRADRPQGCLRGSCERRKLLGGFEVAVGVMRVFGRLLYAPDDDWLGGTFHQHPPECVQQLTMVHGLREPRRSAQLGRS